MRTNLDLTGGLISSELVMLTLGRVIGRQVAHEVVYDAAQSVHGGGSFAAALRADPRIAGQLSEDELAALLDPASHTGLSGAIAREAAARAAATAARLA
jgi:3-carboxy-cis,cis-muconate cycloisomerase